MDNEGERERVSTQLSPAASHGEACANKESNTPLYGDEGMEQFPSCNLNTRHASLFALY